MSKLRGGRRKLLIKVTPSESIKENLREAVFRQILENITKFKAFEMKTNDEDEFPSKSYRIVLNEPKNERRVKEIIQKFNFQIAAD